MRHSLPSLCVVLALGGAACGPQAPTPATPASGGATAPNARPGVPWLSEPVDTGPIVDWEDGQYLQAGTVRDTDHHTISFAAAVTHSENGKPVEGIWDRWEIWCSDPPSGQGGAARRAAVDCSLDWLTIADTALAPDGAVVMTHHFDSRFGETTSRITDVKADWAAGTLAFTLPNLAGLAAFQVSPARVDIRFRQVDSVFYLTDLHAVATERAFDAATRQERAVTYDYRLADRTQVLNVPVLMPGLRSAGQSRWNALVAALGEADRAEWRRLSREARSQLNARINDIGPETEKRARARMADYDSVAAGRRKMTPEEARWLDDLTAELSSAAFRDWLAASTLSRDAQRQMAEHFASGVNK